MPRKNSSTQNLPSDNEGGGGPGSSASRGDTADGGSSDRRRELLRYAGLSSEVAASIGVAVFLGIKGDKWLKVSFPILSWALPLLVIVVLLVNLIRAGSGKKNGK